MIERRDVPKPKPAVIEDFRDGRALVGVQLQGSSNQILIKPFRSHGYEKCISFAAPTPHRRKHGMTATTAQILCDNAAVDFFLSGAVAMKA